MKATILAALLVAMAATAAIAEVEPGTEGNLAEFVPVPGERICFARSYDAAHSQSTPNRPLR